MFKVELDLQGFYQIIKKIREAKESDLLLEISESCPFLENMLAFKIIKNEAKSGGGKVVFVAKAPRLYALVENLNGDEPTFGFVRGFDVNPVVGSDQGLAPSANWFVVGREFLKSRIFLRADLGFIFAVVALLTLVSFYLLFYALPSATIVLTVADEPLVKSIEIVASPSAARVEVGSRVIPAVTVSAVAKKSLSGPATGTKEVGEKARGEVTVYNKTESAKVFAVKTPLSIGRRQGPDLVYLLDSEILAPAQALDISGVATVSATAEKIGEEYNISTNSLLTIGASPTNSFVAETNRNLSGGSRRSVTVVTEEDQRKLLASAKAELEGGLLTEIRGKIVSDQKLDENSVAFSLTNQNFDKSVSEEASSFNLTLEEKATALLYSDGDLTSLASEVLKSYVPDGYDLFGENRTFEVIAVKNDIGNLFFTVKVKGSIVPHIDIDKIKQAIAGLSPASANQYLGSLGQFITYQIDNRLRVAGLDFLPRNKSAIKIVVERK